MILCASSLNKFLLSRFSITFHNLVPSDFPILSSCIFRSVFSSAAPAITTEALGAPAFNDFSDSFLSIVQSDADIITTEFNQSVIKEFIDANYGKQSVYPKLKVTGINDKAGKELAEIINLLKNDPFKFNDSSLQYYR